MKTVVYNFIVAFFCLFGIIACTVESELPAEMNLKATLIGNPQCKSSRSVDSSKETPNSQSCVTYAYNQVLKTLKLSHINAGFNCCPDSLSCVATFRNDTIIIQEFEKNMGCKCNCLYDLEIVVDGVEPGIYQLSFIEPYLLNQEKLCFKIDLKNQNQGSYCVKRTIYPWGQ